MANCKNQPRNQSQNRRYCIDFQRNDFRLRIQNHRLSLLATKMYLEKLNDGQLYLVKIFTYKIYGVNS